MFHVHDGYRKTFRIPARAFNFLAKFCNNLSPGFGITMRRPEEPSSSNPVTVAVNTEDLTEAGFATLQANATAEGQTVAELVSSATPADVAEYDADEADEDKQARIGASNCAARADHQHMMPFAINPLADGEDAANNVAATDLYVPTDGETADDVDLSGTSSYAARADHTHILPLAAADGETTEIYVPSENESTSGLQLSGTSEECARADHTHVVDFGGWSGTLFAPTGGYQKDDFSIWLRGNTLTVKNGLIAKSEAAADLQIV